MTWQDCDSDWDNAFEFFGLFYEDRRSFACDFFRSSLWSIRDPTAREVLAEDYSEEVFERLWRYVSGARLLVPAVRRRGTTTVTDVVPEVAVKLPAELRPERDRVVSLAMRCLASDWLGVTDPNGVLRVASTDQARSVGRALLNLPSSSSSPIRFSLLTQSTGMPRKELANVLEGFVDRDTVHLASADLFSMEPVARQLRSICRSVLADHGRSVRGDSAVSLEVLIASGFDPVDPERSVSEQASISELKRRLHEAMQRLSRRQSQCLYAHYIQGLSREQISSLLGISVESVKTHLEAGRAWIRTGNPDLADYLR